MQTIATPAIESDAPAAATMSAMSPWFAELADSSPNADENASIAAPVTMPTMPNTVIAPPTCMSFLPLATTPPHSCLYWELSAEGGFVTCSSGFLHNQAVSP